MNNIIIGFLSASRYDDTQKNFNFMEVFRMKQLNLYEQKLNGLALLILGILTPIIIGDGSFSVIAIPVGLNLLFSKEIIQ